MKKVLTFGVFDLLHYGHFEFFRRAKELAGPEGTFIVALQKDESVAKFKPVRLVYNYAIREAMLKTLRTVDVVVPYESVSVDFVKVIDFDVLCVGPEHNSERFQRVFAWCRENGKDIVVLPRTEGISTTRLKEIIKDL